MLGLLVATLGPASALAQTPAVYRQDSTAIGYAPLPSPTVLIDSGSDEGEWTITLPFAFRFFEDSFTSVTVGANGALLFPGQRNLSFTNRTPGSVDGTAAFIAPFWDDLRLYPGQGRIAWQLFGTAPSRVVVVEWQRLSRFGASDSALSFQVRLHEGPSGRIDTDYGPLTSGRRSFDASIGMESTTERVVTWAAPCSPTCRDADWPGPDRRFTLRLDAGPELEIRAPVLPERLTAGRQLSTTVRVRNGHGATIGPFAVTVELDRNPDFTTGFEVGRSVTTVGPYQERAVSLALDLPETTAPGPFYVRARVDPDGVVTETDETNNAAVASTRVSVVPGGPNLSALTLTIPDALQAGQSATATLSYQIEGMLPRPPEVSLWLSGNPIITDRDRRLGASSPLSTQAGLQSQQLAFTLPSDLASGIWHLGARLDPDDAVAEGDESDNAVSSPPLEIAGRGLAIATTELPRGRVGESYSVQLRAVPADAAWMVQGLPDGLQSNAEGGISGVPTTTGTSNVRVTANRAGQSSSTDLNLTVQPPGGGPVLVTRALADGIAGRPYLQPLDVRGLDGALRATGLPPGLEVSARALRGRPATAGTWSIGFILEGGSEPLTVLRPLVVREPVRPTIVPGTLQLASGTEGQTTLVVRGGVSPFRWESSALPEGFELSAAGRLTAAPRIGPRAVSIPVTVVDGEGDRDDSQIVVEYLAASTATLFTLTLPEGRTGEPYAEKVDVPGAASIERLTGRLPAGLTERSTSEGFLIEGVPRVEARSESLLLRVLRSDGTTQEGTVLIPIAPAEATPQGCQHTNGENGGVWIGAFLLLVFPFRTPRRRLTQCATSQNRYKKVCRFL